MEAQPPPQPPKENIPIGTRIKRVAPFIARHYPVTAITGPTTAAFAPTNEIATVMTLLSAGLETLRGLKKHNREQFVSELAGILGSKVVQTPEQIITNKALRDQIAVKEAGGTIEPTAEQIAQAAERNKNVEEMKRKLGLD